MTVTKLVTSMAAAQAVARRGQGDANSFQAQRVAILKSVEAAAAGWNGAVAALVRQIGEMDTFARRDQGDNWHDQVARALDGLREPLHSDVILSVRSPMLANRVLKGNVRVFGATVLEQDIEFMPKPMKYPKFPYFQVEPATLDSLHKAGLVLLANPAGIQHDEPNEPGAQLDLHTYLRGPMVSVELRLEPLPAESKGAVLLNWSFRGRAGAHAKIFINGEQDNCAFEVLSTDDDAVPNFWTLLPWTPGSAVIDLKHVGTGYMWFEHVDVHHVTWATKR